MPQSIPDLGGDSDSDGEGVTLTVNEKFASKFEAQEQKREFAYLQSKGLLEDSDQSGSSSEESDDDEAAAAASSALDAQLASVIISLRAKDPKIYDAKHNFFAADAAGVAEGPTGTSKKAKAKKYKDVLREQVLEDADTLGFARPDLEEGGGVEGKLSAGQDSIGRKGLLYDDEQKKLREAFLTGVAGESSEEGSESGENDEESDEGDNEDDDGSEGEGAKKKKKEKKTRVVSDAGGMLRAKQGSASSSDAVRARTEAASRLAQALAEKPSHNQSEGATASATSAADSSKDAFLQDFIMHERWRDRDSQNRKSHGDSDSDDDKDGSSNDGNEEDDDERGLGSNRNFDDDEDLAEVDRMERFESKYNFRFEEEEAARAALREGHDHASGDVSAVPPSMRGLLGQDGTVSFGKAQVQSFSRTDAPGTLRRKDETRKNARAELKERKAAERNTKEQELRRLKNLKAQALKKKLEEISALSGGAELDVVDLDGDFDPDKFDAAMANAFGDDYYGQDDDQHPGTGGLLDSDEDFPDVDSSDSDSDDTGLKKKKKNNKKEDKKMAAAKKKNKNDASSSLETTSAASAAAAEAKKLAEEVSALEYDDIVDGEATKFKYATVAKEDYGLSTEEILAADDQLLNSFVSLKKVAAPYREGQLNLNARKRKKFREELKRQASANPQQRKLLEEGKLARSQASSAAGESREEEGEEEGGEEESGGYGDSGGYDENDDQGEGGHWQSSQGDGKKKRKRRRGGAKNAAANDEDSRGAAATDGGSGDDGGGKTDATAVSPKEGGTEADSASSTSKKKKTRRAKGGKEWKGESSDQRVDAGDEEGEREASGTSQKESGCSNGHKKAPSSRPEAAAAESSSTNAIEDEAAARKLAKKQAKRAKEKAQRQEKKQKSEAPPSLAASRLAAYGL